MPANLEISAVATGLEKFSFHSNPKERQCHPAADGQPPLYHTLHSSLKCVDGVNLRDDDAGPESPQGLGTALAHVAIARNHCHLARNHDVCGPLDAIYEGLPAAIEVVKFAL